MPQQAASRPQVIDGTSNLTLAVLLAFAILSTESAVVTAIAGSDSDEWQLRLARPREQQPRIGFSTAAAETVFVGYSPSSTDPNKVGVGGLWDFDTDIAGTDSSQFWQYHSLNYSARVDILPGGSIPSPPGADLICRFKVSN